MPQCVNISLPHSFPFFGAGIKKHVIVGNTRVVDEKSYRSKCLLGSVKCLGESVTHRYIQWNGNGICKPLFEFLQPLYPASSKNNLCSVGSENFGKTSPEARGGSCYQRHFASQIEK